MRRLLYAGLLVLMGFETAGAQTILQRPRYQSPYPTTSPYLNMIRGGNPAINYYGVVRPQTEMNRSLQGLQTEMQMTEQALLAGTPMGAAAGGMPPAISTTGHPIAFGNTSHYFPAPGQRPGATSGMPQNSPSTGVSPSFGLGIGAGGVQPFVGFNFNRR